MDIIALSMSEGVNINALFRRCLRAYADGDTSFRIKTPDTPPAVPMRPMTIVFYLNENMDGELIRAWDHIRRGQKGHVLKLLLRHYLTQPILSPYIVTDTGGAQGSGAMSAADAVNAADIGRTKKRRHVKQRNNTDRENGITEDVHGTAVTPKSGETPSKKRQPADAETEDARTQDAPPSGKKEESVSDTADDFDLFAAMMSIASS